MRVLRRSSSRDQRKPNHLHLGELSDGLPSEPAKVDASKPLRNRWQMHDLYPYDSGELERTRGGRGY